MKNSVSHSAAVSAPGLTYTGKLPCTWSLHLVLCKWTVPAKVLVGVTIKKFSWTSFSSLAPSWMRTGDFCYVMDSPRLLIKVTEVTTEH